MQLCLRQAGVTATDFVGFLYGMKGDSQSMLSGAKPETVQVMIYTLLLVNKSKLYSHAPE